MALLFRSLFLSCVSWRKKNSSNLIRFLAASKCSRELGKWIQNRACFFETTPCSLANSVVKGSLICSSSLRSKAFITLAIPLEFKPFLVSLSVVEYTGSRADWVSLLSAGAEISGWGILFFPLNAFTFPKTTKGVFSFKERRIHFAPLNQTSSINPVPSVKVATSLFWRGGPTSSILVI